MDMKLEGDYFGYSHSEEAYIFSVLGKASEVQEIVRHAYKVGIQLETDYMDHLMTFNPNGYILIDFKIDPKDATYLRMLCQG
jgi:hypothetical protein